jgi:hypothetical protein
MLHNVKVDVRGIEVKQHIFVASYVFAKLILGRPWDRTTRAAIFANEDHGSYTVTIRSPDNVKEFKVLASSAEHEQNQEFVRSKD